MCELPKCRLAILAPADFSNKSNEAGRSPRQGRGRLRLDSAMRSTPETKPAMPAANGDSQLAAPVAASDELIERIAAELAACDGLGDPELARQTGRKLLAVVACAADALLRDGGAALRAAPDKFGAFFDKAAAGYVAAIDGLHKRAVLADLAAGNDLGFGG